VEWTNSLQFLLLFFYLCEIYVVVINITQITHSHGSARVVRTSVGVRENFSREGQGLGDLAIAKHESVTRVYVG